jgi:Putative transposase/Transposase zinc-binding domain
VLRPSLEVADIFRDFGPAWRAANRGHVSLHQLKVMSAIERCRTAALGGHVARCENSACGFTTIAYNSCRNRHCPKCQGAQAAEWMEDRAAELLPVPYFHVVFTLPAEIADIAYTNKAVVYDALFKASSETLARIAADPKHLGAKIGMTSVLHTWGSAMTHHPHVHMIVPGGGFSADGSEWVAAKPKFFLPVFVLSKLFRRLMLEKLAAAHAEGKLAFFGVHAHLKAAPAFAKWLAPQRQKRWFVYAKEPFAGPKAVLAYLSRYTHRVAISNSRLLKAEASGVTFRVKNYRADGDARYTTMTLAPGEFIRRVLLHVLPKGFHRIRHTGFLASGGKAANIEKARALLGVVPDVESAEPASAGMPPPAAEPGPSRACPCCGGTMHIIETFEGGGTPRHRAEPSRWAGRIDTS